MPENPEENFISALFSDYRQMMYRIAFNILGNRSDAEDAVQDAFLWIINNFEKISEIPCNKRACYFASIIEHLSINMINKKRRHPFDDIDEHIDISSDVSVENNVVERLTVEEVKEIIKTMSVTDRLILRLYLLEGRSYAEISDIAGITEGNARVCVHRARKRLAKLLKKKGIDYED